jgi:hypothetical protein
MCFAGSFGDFVLEREQLLRFQRELLMRVRAALMVVGFAIAALAIVVSATGSTEPVAEESNVGRAVEQPRWRIGVPERSSGEDRSPQELQTENSQEATSPPSQQDPVLHRIDSLEARLMDEPPDHAAGISLRSQLEENRGDRPLLFEEVSCGSSVCRVVLRVDDAEANGSAIVSAFVSGSPFTDGPGGSVVFPGEASNDLSVAVVHLVRPGHVLPN